MAAVLPESDGESNSGELRTTATIGSGVVVLPARTHTVNYGARNNKHARVYGDLQGADGGGGWRRGARDRKEEIKANPATNAATNGDGGVAGGGEEKWRRRAPGRWRRQGGVAPGRSLGGGGCGTDPEGSGPLLICLSRAERKRKERKKN